MDGAPSVACGIDRGSQKAAVAPSGQVARSAASLPSEKAGQAHLQSPLRLLLIEESHGLGHLGCMLHSVVALLVDSHGVVSQQHGSAGAGAVN